jgi:hypothetical protein
MCPFSKNGYALCIAGLESLMVDRKYCFGAKYKECPIFLINKSIRSIDFNETETLE